LNYSYKFNLST